MGLLTQQANPTRLAFNSNHPPTMSRAKRLRGPLAVRQALGVSALKMRDALSDAGCRVRTHQTVYTWERAEREPDALPRGYWKRYYMPDAVVAAYHEMIAAYVELASHGRYTARVTGKRRWRVELRRVR